MSEELYEKKLICTMVCRSPATLDDMKDVIKAIHKIIDNKNELLN